MWSPRYVFNPERDLVASAAQEVGPGVWRLPLLSEAACAAWRRDLAEFRAWVEDTGDWTDPPNSMHEYGFALEPLGYGPSLRGLLEEVRTFAAARYPDVGGGGLDAVYGFAVEYGDVFDWDLALHVDNAQVTLNLCVGDDFAGGELYFEGVRCPEHRQTPARREERFEVEQAPGVALLHLGAHRHGALPLVRGVRRNLILWCRSSAAPAWGTCEECRTPSTESGARSPA